ncbi:MAG: GyrI-like domain-containing protein [Chloroflexota bacterium]|jgi:hypothetical protein
MQTMDLKTQYKYLFTASAKIPALVDVPRLKFLRVDGAIEPGHTPGDSPLFMENMQALYGAAYTLKFMLKQRADNPLDYPLMALEGLWWVEDNRFDIQVKDNWFYTLQILLPEVITAEAFAAGLQALRKKRGSQPAFERLRLEEFEEGRCVQMMHIGPYASEPATVAKMEAFAAANGLRFQRMHHEIYLGDPRRADASRLKTILRHPVTGL